MKVACPWMASPPEGRAIKEFHAIRQEKKSLCALSKFLMLNAHNPPISMKVKTKSRHLRVIIFLAILEIPFVNKKLRKAYCS
jgi:hypothetical protein